MGMPASHTLVFALMNGATGLTVPVLTLMLLARGATLETLSLFMGITLIVTVALEVPSGVAADALGRKRLFMIAMLLNVAGYVLLAAGVSAWLVAASSVLRGMALAARTGTIESIEVDRIMRLPGSEEERLAALDRLNGRLTLLESGGTAAGSLVGGLLAALDGSYVTLIGAVCALDLIVVGLAAHAFPSATDSAGQDRPQVHEVILEVRRAVRSGQTMRLVLWGSVAAGVVMLAVETYWQASFICVAGERARWMLGPVSCAGQVSAALGSVAAARWGSALAARSAGRGRAACMLASLLATACALMALGAATAMGFMPLFVGGYVTFYLFVGAWSVFEQTLLHQAAPARERSSMMSVQSIALRTGGFAASAAGVPLGAALSLPWIWLVFALVSVLPLLFSARGAGSRRAAESCRTEGI